MFKLFTKQNNNNYIRIKIDGMHCPSCSINIDSVLEDLPEVIKSNTSYAKGETVLEYNANQINLEKIYNTIESLGYKIKRDLV